MKHSDYWNYFRWRNVFLLAVQQWLDWKGQEPEGTAWLFHDAHCLKELQWCWGRPRLLLLLHTAQTNTGTLKWCCSIWSQPLGRVLFWVCPSVPGSLRLLLYSARPEEANNVSGMWPYLMQIRGLFYGLFAQHNSVCEQNKAHAEHLKRHTEASILAALSLTTHMIFYSPCIQKSWPLLYAQSSTHSSPKRVVERLLWPLI